MVIAASVVLLLAFLLAHPPDPVPQKGGSGVQSRRYEPNHQRRFANRLPGFGILTHLSRKSGRVYRLPVNVFRAPEGFLIALTMDETASGSKTYYPLVVASLRPAAWCINFPHQPSCMTPLGDGSRMSCV